MAGRPLRPATDHRLGRPLPHQRANRTQPPPGATSKEAFPLHCLQRRAYAVLHPVSEAYPPHQGRLATCSSPVRHGRPPKGLPFDLHALGTPPALILSQDQTLHQKPCSFFTVVGRPRPRAVTPDTLRTHHPRARTLARHHGSVGNVLPDIHQWCQQLESASLASCRRRPAESSTAPW